MPKRQLLISKTDYKIARSCPTKLYYRMNKYPSTNDEDEYIELLAEGGYMIGAIASLLFEDAVLVDEPDHDKAVALTREYFQQENIILLEAAFESQGKFARPDILIKRGNALTLIEVKAKSFDSGAENPLRGKRGGIASNWQPYLEDITFQALILRELFPHFTLTSELMMPDKSKTTSIDKLHALFALNQIAEDDSGYPRARFNFTGDVQELRRSHFLTRVNVDLEVEELLPEVSAAADAFIKSLNPLTKLPVKISFACKDCEYRVGKNELKNGFRECWGNLADPEPHLLDLYFGGTVKEVQALIEAGKTSLFDLSESALGKKDGSLGPRAQRQVVQMRNSKSQTEWIDPALGEILSSHAYPLHFIDFETSGLAVPYHAGMRPFENVAFQWSCHTIETLGAEPIHTEWINLEDAFPNFAFAESLMNHLGGNGTVFMWATHESTILKQIRAQLEGRMEHAQLRDWLDWITGGCLIDMNDLTLKYYFHPIMKGRTSIKNVLDAVWQTNAGLRKRYPEYVKEEDGKLLSPHKSLPPLEINGQDAFVNEGTGAITAYQSMLYGPQKGDGAIRENWKQLLLQYCKLDTLAMVMIYWHWVERLGRITPAKSSAS
ncbi:MAG TPA: DUF2779 domain-containing protein [Anaerolineales bacterium]|nr:DUF2779 domain-containing protein [Anaerolineales bacterium]